PRQPTWSRAEYHLYVIRTPARVPLKRYFNEAGIGTGIHYPIPIHLQFVYASLGCERGDFPVSETAADEVLSLPMFPGLRSQAQQRVVDTICEFASTRSVR